MSDNNPSKDRNHNHTTKHNHTVHNRSFPPSKKAKTSTTDIMSETTTTTTTSTVVQLAIYDLSMGMASTLSGQLLGLEHAVPMIPHTAIIVFGREYFFSSGIQNMHPNSFRQSRGIQPVQVITVGHTGVSKERFDHWCYNDDNSDNDTNGARRLYNEHSYDLFQRNCNHFSDYALKHGLSMDTGVPQWILDIPDKVRRSPMGQMLMPMMQGVQAPFSTTTAQPTPSPANQNPWAHLPSTKPNAVTTHTDTIPSSQPKTVQKTPFLDSHSKLLLSVDTATIPLCINKLKALSKSDDDVSSLDTLQNNLTTHTPTSPSTIEHSLSHYILTTTTPSNHKKSATVMALMLLRLVLLQPLLSPKDDYTILSKCLTAIASHLINNNNILMSSIPARSMAWCTLSNAMINPHLFVESLSVHTPYNKTNNIDNNNDMMQQLVDCAIQDSTHDRKEVSQSACAFLHNLVHVVVLSLKQSNNNTKMPTLLDWAVTLLCDTLESVSKDDVTQFRRWLTAAKLIQGFGKPAKSLLIELGLPTVLEKWCTEEEGKTNKTKVEEDSRTLVQEMLCMLESSS